MNKKIVLMLVSLLFVSSFAFSGVTSAQEHVIKVGIIGPKGEGGTPLPHWSPGGMWDGARMAAMEINTKGGVNIGGTPYTIQLLEADEYSYPTIDETQARASISSLIDAGAKFIYGGFRTEVTDDLIGVAMAERVPFFINGAATSWLVNLSTPELYQQYKYLFRINPINDSYLLPVITDYLKDYLIPKKLLPMYGKDLGMGYPQIKVAVLTEHLDWTLKIHYALTTYPIYTMLLGPYANVSQTASGRIPITAETTVPWLNNIQSEGCHLMIIIFSAPVGELLIREWAQNHIESLPVGINVMAQLQYHWPTTGGKCEYEVILNFAGTRTPIIPGVTEVFWDNFLGNYSVWPIYTAWGAYNGLYGLKDALERANPQDVLAYLEGTGTAEPLISYFEATDMMVINGRFRYSDGIYGPGTGHDVYTISTGINWTDSFTRSMAVQWIQAKLEVVSPQNQPYSKKTRIPPWMYDLADWDLNFDGIIDYLDINPAARAFGATPGTSRWWIEADVNGDGIVDYLDINPICRNFGKQASQWPLDPDP